MDGRRLKRTLRRNLHGEKIVVVSNREPYIHDYAKDGSIVVQHPASGLVTALEPVMRACSGVWIAHGSGAADRAVVDKHDRVMVPPDEKIYSIRRVWLTEEEEKGYYYGFSNEGLWPLCHVAHTRPLFRTSDWKHYCEVNQKFADAVVAEAEIEDPIVLIQDYHLALAPRMIRLKLPRATVIGFWHIPWPNAERFGICPWREEILDGMLGASMLGFHTQAHCNNFMDSVDRYLESRIDRERQAVVQQGRSTLIRPTRSRSSGRFGGSRICPPRQSAGGVCSLSSVCPRTRFLAWASIGLTTPRASRSGCSRSNVCSSCGRSSSASSCSCSSPRQAGPRLAGTGT